MKRVMTFAAVLLLLSLARGQNTPDFSGTWRLNLLRSDHGDLQGPSSRTDVIKHYGDNLTEGVHERRKGFCLCHL